MHLFITGQKAQIGGETYKVAIGRGGFSSKKHEGDGTTPLGVFSLRTLYYRADKVSLPPGLRLKRRAISPEDGWCDAPRAPQYNRIVKLPCGVSHEKLWRDDGLYDLVLVIGYNDDPIVPGQGSAVFIHIARENFAPTRGCVALQRQDFMRILEQLNPASQVVISRWESEIAL